MRKSLIVLLLVKTGLLSMIADLWALDCPPLNVDLGKDTVVCENGVLILDAGEGVSWLWQDGKTDRYYNVTLPGTYWVQVTDACANVDRDTIKVTRVLLPDFSISLPDRPYFCKGEVVNLSATVASPTANYDLTWSFTAAKTNTVTIDTGRIITLTVKDQYGCTRTREKYIDFQYPYEKDSIIMVSYDKTIGRNILVYNRTPSRRTKGYVMFNGTSETNVMAVRNFMEMNLLVDEGLDPHQKSSYYNLTVLDSCENKSDFRMNRVHKSMFMQTNKNLITGRTSMVWERYYGIPFTKYYIFRGTTEDNLEIIDSVAHDGADFKFYVDTTGIKTTTYYYQVGIKLPKVVTLDNPQGRKASGGPFIYILSNLEDNRQFGSGINDIVRLQESLKIYPNPFTAESRIEFELQAVTDVKILCRDVTGKLVTETAPGLLNPGLVNLPLYELFKGKNAGIYFISLELDGALVQTRKIIVQ
jgi:hypothetical protein